jgi:phage shock protein E
MFSFFKNLFSNKDMDTIKELVKSGAAVVVDVRSPQEFAGGSVKGAKNIPLDKLESQIDKIKAFQKPVVLCCASGMRSARAASILRGKGLENIHDAGGWTNLA